MAFTLLVDSARRPIPQAVLERSTGICIAYGGSRDNLQALLGATGGGEILLRIQDPSTLPPDGFVVYQDGIYYVWIAGTTNPDQMLGQIRGDLSTPAVPVLGQTNSFWVDIARRVSPYVAVAIQERESARSGLPTPVNAFGISLPSPAVVPTLRIEFIGDSYGSAVALILAIAYAERYGEDNVRACLFGAPKVVLERYAGPAPGVLIRPHRNADPVPYLPPTAGVRMSVKAEEGEPDVGVFLQWAHLGSGWLIGDDGLLSMDPYDTRVSWLAVGVFTAFAVKEHLYRNVAAILSRM